VLFWRKWRKKTKAELANKGSPGKWLLIEMVMLMDDLLKNTKYLTVEKS